MPERQLPPDIADQTIVKLPADIGALVRLKRKHSGLTQAQAAGLCNVGTRFLSDLENGKPTVHLGKTLKVLYGFGIVVALKRRTFANMGLGVRQT